MTHCHPHGISARLLRLTGAAASIAVATTALAPPTAAFAQAPAYPASPVRVIVPYEPGGASDVLARVVTKGMKEDFGQTLFVENRAGGGAQIGTAAVATAAPNGYTVGAVDSSFVINPALVGSKLPYDTLRDFKPVSFLAKMPFILVVNSEVKATTLAQLVQMAKDKPGSLNFASAGNGSPLHLAGEQFKHAARIDIVHVPYKGGASSVAATVSGQTQMAITVLSSSMAFIQTGQLRPLAVTSSTRLPELPNVPTFEEAGLPAVNSVVSFGIVAPKDTSDEVVNRLSAAFDREMKKDEVRKQLARLGFQPVGGPPKVYGDFVSSESAKWKTFVQEARVKVD